MSYNKIILVGNLTRDIELRYTQSDAGIAKTAIATSRKFTNNGEKKEEVCFVDITFFGRSAEVANQYLRKGSKILVEGRLNFEQWQDQQGQKRSKHGVIVETMQMLDSKSDSQLKNTQANNYAQQGITRPQSNNTQANQQQGNYVQNGNSSNQQQPTYEYQNVQGQQTLPPIDFDEDEIPF